MGTSQPLKIWLNVSAFTRVPRADPLLGLNGDVVESTGITTPHSQLRAFSLGLVVSRSLTRRPLPKLRQFLDAESHNLGHVALTMRLLSGCDFRRTSSLGQSRRTWRRVSEQISSWNASTDLSAHSCSPAELRVGTSLSSRTSTAGKWYRQTMRYFVSNRLHNFTIRRPTLQLTLMPPRHRLTVSREGKYTLILERFV